MKYLKSLLLIVAFSFAQASTAQVIVDGVNINSEEEVEIVQLLALGNLFSKKVTIIIDYGQFIKFGSNKGSVVTDTRGNLKKFNSSMAAINYMENNGWELIDVNSVPNPNSNAVVYYFFRRKK